MEDKLAILRGVPLFADLDERSLQAVAILAHEADVKAGDVLMVEGEAGEAFYVIVDGTIRIEAGDRTIRSMTAGRLPRRDRARRIAGRAPPRRRRVTDARLLEIRAARVRSAPGHAAGRPRRIRAVGDSPRAGRPAATGAR